MGEDLSSARLEVSGAAVVVRGAAVSDRGMFLCTAESSAGSARASAILEVEPRQPPVVELYPEPRQTVQKWLHCTDCTVLYR